MEKTLVDSLLFRLEAPHPELVREIVYSIPEKTILDSECKFLDPAMGGGHFLRAIHDRAVELGVGSDAIKKRLYGIERSIVYTNYARWKMNLEGANLRTSNDYDLELFDMKFDVIVGNPPYTSNSVATNQTMGGCAKGLDNLFFERCMELAPYVSLIIRSKHFSKASSRFRRKLMESGNMREITVLPADVFPGISLTETCIAVYDADYSGKTRVTFQDGTVRHLVTTGSTCLKFTNPDFNPEVPNNLSPRYERGHLNLNQLQEGDYPIIVTMGARGKDMVVQYVPKEQAVCGVNQHGVVMNSKYGGRGFGKVCVKPFSYAVSGSSILLRTDSEEESKKLQEFLSSKEIQDLATKNKISNANTKELFKTLSDPLL